jgi:N-acetylmuramidase
MDMQDFQVWLNSHGQAVPEDGHCGQTTREAIKAVFTNLRAKAVTVDQMHKLADWLGVNYNQLVAVSEVESAGSGYDSEGHPKMLYERHKFSDFTFGLHDIESWSNPDPGGYSEDSWDKLGYGAGASITDAFKSCSWGKFQVMGFWYPNMGFCSSLEMAYSTVISEYHHYNLFVRYIKMNNLIEELQLVSTNPDDCRPFAKGYNGPAYEDGGYHVKIADEMQRLEDQSGNVLILDETMP